MDQFSHDPFGNTATFGGAPGSDTAQHRHAVRDSLFLAAELRVAGQLPMQVRVRNLSAGGLMAEYPQQIDIGDAVDVNVRGIGWVRGRIVWTSDARIGIAFDRPIDPQLARKPVGTKASGKTRPHA